MAAGLLALLVSFPAAAQSPSGRDVVSPAVHVSPDPVVRGSSFELAVTLTIRPGFHINARKKSADYLIATDLQVDAPEGFKSGEVRYPEGTLRKFAFSKSPLNVYQDRVILGVPVAALAGAPLGSQNIPLKLRYQACSNDVCLPPVTLQVDATVNVVAAK
jgi:thiol:disulfide interchange protein DsbD